MQNNVQKPVNTYDPSKYIRGVKVGDGRTQTSNVDNEIKERIRASQQVKGSTFTQNQSNVNNNNSNFQFDNNFGKSVSVSTTVNNNNNFGGGNTNFGGGNTNFGGGNTNNFQPSNIEEQTTTQVDNPYASINFNSNSQSNMGGNKNMSK